MGETGKTYLIGELAEATGVTVRTLQHYDHIGLLPTSGRTASGRRSYTEEDVLTLEQIIFYRTLGLSLPEIRDKVVNRPELSQIESILQKQEMALYKKIEDAHVSLAAIEAYRAAIAAGNYPSWQLLTSFIRILKNSNLMDWKEYAFSDVQKEVLGRRFAQGHGAFELYHTWRALTLKAVTLARSGEAADGPAAQKLAEAWRRMVREAIGGDAGQIQAFAQLQEDRASWPEGDRDLMEASQAFIDRAVKHFLSSPSSDARKNGGDSEHGT